MVKFIKFKEVNVVWNPKEGLIQVEIGTKLVKAFTEKDNRNILSKGLGLAPPEEGKMLLAYANGLREKLGRDDKIFLPSIKFKDNPDIGPSDFIAYIGLNAWHMQALKPIGMFDWIEDRVRTFNTIPSDIISIKVLIDEAFTYAARQDYQNAFDKYSLAYYHSFINSYNYEFTRCIFDVGNIKLMGNKYSEAQVLFKYALSWLDSINIVDANMKMHCTLSMANTYKLLGEYNNALEFYKRTFEIAETNNNAAIMVLSLLNVSEIQYINNKFKNALVGLERAKSLVLFENNSKNYELAFLIQEKITEIYIHISNELIDNQNKKSEGQNMLKGLFTQLIDVICKEFIKSSINGVIFKLLGVNKLSPIISFFGDVKNVDTKIINSSISSERIQIGINNKM